MGREPEKWTEPRAFAELEWQTRFVERLPGDPIEYNATRLVSDICYSITQPTPVAQPRLLGWSDRLGSELGIARPSGVQGETADRSLELLSGNRVLPTMRPYAARYGGHQFGSWAGQLGDGRAITLGEAVIAGGRRMEFQLKGAGPTPYSRRADGRAVLRSSMREFLCSEAMHFLGVPTTRALSLVTTGEDVVRDMFYDGNPLPEPGAIVCRVAPSFLRFGNFQILAASEEPALLKQLADLLIADHFPEIDSGAPDPYGRLLDDICRRTARMIAHWMRVGFVHGVMNTDNMSVLGLTIDYGPYGWLEPFDPSWTPNTTDAEGRRYRFGGQPNIALWNLVRFAEALLPLIGSEDRVHASLDIYQDTFEATYEGMLARKLGLSSLQTEEDQRLTGTMFGLLASVETDFTIFFRKLADWQDRLGDDFLTVISSAFYTPDALPAELVAGWKAWSGEYLNRLKREAASPAERCRSMKSVSPKYVLRNYLAQNAITAAQRGDASEMERLLRVLSTPYDELPADEDLAARRPDWARDAPGCSALSCSS